MKLQELRKLKKIKIQEILDILQITKGSYYGKESGQYSFTIEEGFALAKLLEVDFMDIEFNLRPLKKIRAGVRREKNANSLQE